MEKDDKIIRQRGVCHTQYNLHCKCFVNPKGQDLRRVKGPCSRVRPPIQTKKSKSALSPATTDVYNKKTQRREWSFTTRNRPNEDLERYKAKGKMTKKEYSDDDEDYDGEQKLSEEELPRLPADARKVCPCCSKEQPKVQFRNFSTTTLTPKFQINKELHLKPFSAEKKISPTEDKETFTAEGNETTKCDICNCAVCNRYEDYFIHRAVAHSRGSLKPKDAEKISSGSNLSTEVTPNLSPVKCFCFKDKKDYYRELKIEKKDVKFDSRQALNQTSDRCYICKCPFVQTNDWKKSYNEEYNDSVDKCSLCKCPIPSNDDSAWKGDKDRVLPSSPREQFYTDLDKYYGHLISSNEKTNTNYAFGSREKILKKPSSTKLNHLKNVKCGYKKINNEGSGIWEIKASDWYKC